MVKRSLGSTVVAAPMPGFGVWQATHTSASVALLNMQTSHSHDPAAGLKRVPNPPMDAGAGVAAGAAPGLAD